MELNPVISDTCELFEASPRCTNEYNALRHFQFRNGVLPFRNDAYHHCTDQNSVKLCMRWYGADRFATGKAVR